MATRFRRTLRTLRFLRTALGSGRYFHRHFALVTGDAALEDAASIRHEVFCQEKGWEALREDRREIDTMDVHALPIVLYWRPTQRPIACMRLIFATDGPLPIENLTKKAITKDRQCIAEVSRMAVIRDFRDRPGPCAAGRECPSAATHDPVLHRFPFVFASLYLAVLRSAELRGIQNLYFIVQPKLFNNLQRIGAMPERIGDAVEHRGERIPCHISVARMLEGIPLWAKPLWKAVRRQIKILNSSKEGP
ncbi:MAG: PEP-CTERM/exosortase system-associated acyltransferase, partial [Firmicutes bacterium]|nr:PEP-CTERM/exosortase system-associated acyltransferase [Bacillota bacterium]